MPPKVTVTTAQAIAYARELLQTERYPETERACRNILAIDAASADAWAIWGTAAYKTHHYPLAVDFLSQALTLAPLSPLLHGQLAESLRALGRLDDALHHVQEALRILPDDPNLHLAKGNALRDGADLDGAGVAYRDALALAHAHAPAAAQPWIHALPSTAIPRSTGVLPDSR